MLEDGGDSVAAVLLKECVSHFKLQGGKARASDASGRGMTESLHPYYHTCDYRGEVQLTGAKSIRVTFDHRWYAACLSFECVSHSASL